MARHDPVESFEQRLALSIAPVEFLRDQESVRRVMNAREKRVNSSKGLPVRQASPKISLQTCGGLVPLLGGLGEKLQNDGR